MYNAIKKNSVFGGIDEEQLKNIFKKIEYKINDYIKGQVVFSEFDYKSEMGIVLKGNVEVQKLHYSGKVIILNRMVEGDILGILALFNNKNYYPTRIVAKNNCKILFVHQKEMLKIFEMNSIVLRNYLSFISDKIYFLNKRIEGFTYENIHDRILCFFESEKQKQNNQKEIILRFSKQELAEYLCISKASLYRVLNHLAEEGGIKWKKNKIVFKND